MCCWIFIGTGFVVDVLKGPSWCNVDGWIVLSCWCTIRFGDVDGDGCADICGRDSVGFECWFFSGAEFFIQVLGLGWSDFNSWDKSDRYGIICFGSLIQCMGVFCKNDDPIQFDEVEIVSGSSFLDVDDSEKGEFIIYNLFSNTIGVDVFGLEFVDTVFFVDIV